MLDKFSFANKLLAYMFKAKMVYTYTDNLNLLAGKLLYIFKGKIIDFLGLNILIIKIYVLFKCIH